MWVLYNQTKYFIIDNKVDLYGLYLILSFMVCLSLIVNITIGPSTSIPNWDMWFTLSSCNLALWVVIGLIFD